MTLSLRPAQRVDAAFLLDLEEVCMRGYAEALWGSWQPSATAATLDLDGCEIVAWLGERAGCVAVTWHPDHLRIRKLYLAPAFQRRGIGALVLRAKTDAAAGAGLPVRLSVLASNPADRFYRREGFAIESETAERRWMVKALS